MNALHTHKNWLNRLLDWHPSIPVLVSFVVVLAFLILGAVLDESERVYMLNDEQLAAVALQAYEQGKRDAGSEQCWMGWLANPEKPKNPM